MENLQITSSIEYYKSIGIDIEILDDTVTPWKIKIQQRSLCNNNILNQKQLVQCAKEIFERAELKVIVIPVTYSIQLETITLDWIEEKMNSYGIKKNDLKKQLGLTSVEIANILSGRKPIYPQLKAAFYYYFLCHQITIQTGK
mgnify:FL=1